MAVHAPGPLDDGAREAVVESWVRAWGQFAVDVGVRLDPAASKVRLLDPRGGRAEADTIEGGVAILIYETSSALGHADEGDEHGVAGLPAAA